jgi:ABC-type transport system substrate-binding protein
MVIRYNKDIVTWDPYFADTPLNIISAWMESLFTDDWTMDPAVFGYKVSFRPSEYVKGYIAETWEFTDQTTLTIHLRHGIHWQDISPANGREFTSADVVWQYNWLFGLGGGYTKPSPYQASVANFKQLQSVVAPDNYTVKFKWTTPNPELILETLQSAQATSAHLCNREAVEKFGDLNDWHHAIGTGPFILKDFVSGSSAAMVKNPNYWGYDERYPKNKLPYIDQLKILIIPDDATALAGIRTGKIDGMDRNTLAQVQSIQKSNPEILQLSIPPSYAGTVDPRNDKAPYNDIRVRKAIQMAIDLPSIAKSYYQGSADPYPSTLISSYLTGWGYSYTDWPQDLKDEYAYNPTAAKKLLAEAGFATGFKTNVIADSTSDLDLLQIVKSYLLAVGIDMDIRTMDAATWSSYVRTARKADQLAYAANGSLAFTFEPLRALNRFVTDYTTNWCMVNDPVFNGFATKSLASSNMDEIKRIVRDANEYVARQHFVLSLLQPTYFALYQPWLKGYNGQFHSISGSSSGTMLLGFYPARFWIDQKLKKSLGH